MPKNLKLAFLTLLLSTIGAGKLSAQQNQKDTLGPAKTTLSKSDSLCVSLLCAPDSYKNFKELFDLQDTTVSLLKTCKAYIQTAETLEELEIYKNLVDTLMARLDYLDKLVSSSLAECFNTFVINPTSLKIYTSINGYLVITGTTIHDSKGYTFFVPFGFPESKQETFNIGKVR